MGTKHHVNTIGNNWVIYNAQYNPTQYLNQREFEAWTKTVNMAAVSWSAKALEKWTKEKMR